MRRGATLTEIIVVMAVFLTLITLTTINLLGAKHSASLSSTITELIADLKSQQLKAMLGDTEGSGVERSYGIYFTSTKYYLFHDTYNPADPNNFGIDLGDNILVVNPNYPLVFAKGSGELPLATSIVLTNSQTGEQKTIQLNKLGIITSIN